MRHNYSTKNTRIFAELLFIGKLIGESNDNWKVIW